MFFRAQNLGPLLDAEVDLSKDLIVLAGPNNSGKTYLAWSVYGLHRHRPAPKGINLILDRWARQLVEAPDHAIDLDELFMQAGPDLLERIAAEYNSSLHLCFAAESERFATATVSLRGGALLHRAELSSEFTGSSMSTLRGDANSGRLDWTIGEGVERLMDPRPLPAEVQAATRSFVTNLPESEREHLQKELARRVYNMVLKRLLPKCTIFPAERIAVNIFAKELALKRTELVDEIVDADLDAHGGASMELVRRKAGRYPWPIRDSLVVANDLAFFGKERSSFAPLADELETAVLGGDVAVSDAGEMLFSPRGATNCHLQMHLTASVVKSLSSLVFYFRHLARRGDFIIVDEPELNLHPDNQRKITRILAKAVQLGFKVMMSTHSDYVLRELNHLIMLSKLPEGEAQRLGYDPQCAIDRERIGVYLFNGQHAAPVPVEETGFSIQTIDDEVNRLNADEQRLYARLFD